MLCVQFCFGRHIAFAALVLYGLVACMTSQLRPNYLFALGAGMGLAHGLLYPAPIVFLAPGPLIWSSLLFLPKARRLSA